MDDEAIASTGVSPASEAAIYGLTLLCLTNLVGYLDRQIITLLVSPVKASLGLSDGGIGVMIGPAFVLTYATAGLFIGRLVDRTNRCRLLIVCVAIWTLGAAGGGFAQQAWQLFLARMAVGIGEAALIPAALSLIGDTFTPTRRGMATGVFTMGVYIGIGMSLILVALALPAITSLSALLLQHGIKFEPWRLVMVAMVVPGVAMCALLGTMREPTRHIGPPQPGAPVSAWKTWIENRRFLLPHHIAMSAVTFGGYAIAGWFPTVMIREQHLVPSAAGLRYGSMVAVVGTLSVYIGGLFSDYCGRSGGARSQMHLAIGCVAVAAGGFVAIGLMPPSYLRLIPAAIAVGGLAIAMVIGMLSLSNATPPRMRGYLTSVYFVFTGVIGTAGGPAAVGYANDAFGGPGRPLSVVLAFVGTIACAIALLSLAIAQRHAGKGQTC